MPELTWEEIKKHDSQESCWIVFEGQVLDVTGYLKKHPGGRWIILENAGKDATEALNRTTHSPIAMEIMWDLCIGSLA